MKKLCLTVLGAAGTATVLCAAPHSAVAAIQYAAKTFADPGVYEVTAAATTNTNRYLPSNAVGDPSSRAIFTVGSDTFPVFWSLGLGGISLFEFDPTVGGTTAESAIIEATAGCNSVNGAGECQSYPESAEVWAIGKNEIVDFSNTSTLNSQTVYDFGGLKLGPGNVGVKLGDATNGTAQGVGQPFGLTSALAQLGMIKYIAVVDTTEAKSAGGKSTDGFDVVAVKITTVEVGAEGAVPVPAALPLFATAMAGLGFLGWRKRKAD